jgi:hypothetical protein
MNHGQSTPHLAFDKPVNAIEAHGPVIPTLAIIDSLWLGKSQKMHFSPENGWIEKLIAQTESAPRELSNE